MNIEEPDPFAVQLHRFDRVMGLRITRSRWSWHRIKEAQRRQTISEVSAGKLPNNQGMHEDLVFEQESP